MTMPPEEEEKTEHDNDDYHAPRAADPENGDAGAIEVVEINSKADDDGENGDNNENGDGDDAEDDKKKKKDGSQRHMKVAADAPWRDRMWEGACSFA